MARKTTQTTKTRLANPCYGSALEKRVYETQWYGVPQPFKLSTSGLTRYAKHFGHALQFNRDSGNVTFDGDAIEQLIKLYPDDPIYPKIGRLREIQKCRGTYIDGIVVDMHGRVHTEFTHKPTTLRLSSKNPNLQNLPRQEDDPDSVYNYAKEIYIAGPGKVLGARDFRGIEAQLVAWLANDPTMLRLTKLGVHAFFASHVLKRPADLSWSDADLSAYFKELKKKESFTYDVCKRVVHLSHYLGTPKRIHELYPKFFPQVKVARYYQDFYLGLFPSIRRWQWDVCREAAQHEYVTTPDGFRQWFYETIGHKRVNGKWEEEFGREAKEAVAAKPQHLAMLYMALALGSIFREDGLCRDSVRLSIHDEILWECAERDFDYVDSRITAIMERPLRLLPLDPTWNMGAHLAVETEGKKGRVWAKMH